MEESRPFTLMKLYDEILIYNGSVLEGGGFVGFLV